MNLVEQLEYLFNPRSVAVVGASNTFGKWGFDMINSALATTQERKVYPVNKNASEVRGLRTYQCVRDIPDRVDFAVITVPYQQVPGIMNDCVDKEIKAALITSGGLSETGEEGAKVEAEIVSIARRGGLRFIGPNSMGHFNTSSDFSTTPWIPQVKKGSVGLISQSGNCGVYILRCGFELGIGFSKFVSSGNEADLCLEDYLEYLAQDEETKVIIAYIEGLRGGRRFFQLAKEITPKKPIIVMKAGRTAGGTKAARSHTAALSGSEAIHEAMFRQAGVIRVDEVDELLDVAGALLRQPLPKGKRVGILTAGGGFGVLATDACERLGLQVAPLSPATIERLNTILPSRWSHANPVDTVAAYLDTFPCLWPLMDDENVDAILLSGGVGTAAAVPKLDGVPLSTMEEIKQILKAREDEELRNWDLAIERMDRDQKPIVVLTMATSAFKDLETFNKLRENGILIYPTPERAAKVLAYLAQAGEYLGISRGGQAEPTC